MLCEVGRGVSCEGVSCEVVRGVSCEVGGGVSCEVAVSCKVVVGGLGVF